MGERGGGAGVGERGWGSGGGGGGTNYLGSHPYFSDKKPKNRNSCYYSYVGTFPYFLSEFVNLVCEVLKSK